MIGERERAYFGLKQIRDDLEVFFVEFATNEEGPFHERESIRLEIIHTLIDKTVQELRGKEEESIL